MSQLSNAPAPAGGGQAIMDAIQQLSEKMQAHQEQLQESLQAHQEQLQTMLQGLTSQTTQIQGLPTQIQGLTLQLKEIHREQSVQHQEQSAQFQELSTQFQNLDKRFENIHKRLVEGFRGASDSFKSTSAEMIWEQSVSHARALNLAARSTPYRRISAKPGRPAYEETDFPTDASKVPSMPEDSCDRLARAWVIEYVEGATLDQKRSAIGRFLGCYTPW